MASMAAVQFRWFSSSFFAYDQRKFEKERERRRGISEIIPLTFWRAYFGGHSSTAGFGGYDDFFFNVLTDKSWAWGVFTVIIIIYLFSEIIYFLFSYEV